MIMSYAYYLEVDKQMHNMALFRQLVNLHDILQLIEFENTAFEYFLFLIENAYVRPAEALPDSGCHVTSKIV